MKQLLLLALIFYPLFVVNICAQDFEGNFESANIVIINFYAKLSNIYSDFVRHESQRLDIKESLLEVVLSNNAYLYNNINKNFGKDTTAVGYIDLYINTYSGLVRSDVTKLKNDSIFFDNNSGKTIYKIISGIQVVDLRNYNKPKVIRNDTIAHYISFRQNSARLIKTEKYTETKLDKDNLTDKDNDGIYDKDDDCPMVYGTVRGCPDQDNDGVIDNEDECPDNPGTLKGCPDSDKDGLADKYDNCPDMPGLLKNKGCPEISKYATIEVPLDLESLKNIKPNSGIVKIKNRQPIKEKSSKRLIFDGSEGFIVVQDRIPNRWIKIVNYFITVNQVKFRNGDSVNLNNMDLNVQIDETRNQIKGINLLINLNEQEELYNYILKTNYN